jgi:hypothetical protein
MFKFTPRLMKNAAALAALAVGVALLPTGGYAFLTGPPAVGAKEQGSRLVLGQHKVCLPPGSMCGILGAQCDCGSANVCQGWRALAACHSRSSCTQEGSCLALSWSDQSHLNLHSDARCTTPGICVLWLR